MRQLIVEQGIDIRNLPVSLAAIVTRIVEAYTNLFVETGINHSVTLSDIATLSPQQLAELFDTVIPAGVRSGMEIVEGNIKIDRANNLDSVVLAKAEVFVRAGFPIADLPDAPDLSALGNLEGIKTVTERELFPEPDLYDPLVSGTTTTTTNTNLITVEKRFYISVSVEPNRNFVNFENNDSESAAALRLPVLTDHVLLAMARMHQSNLRITIDDLYDLLTNLDTGLGARLTYHLFDPNFSAHR